MTENGDLAALLGRLFDEKLAPINHALAELKALTRGLSGSLGRINERLSAVETRLAVVEAILEIEPHRPKH